MRLRHDVGPARLAGATAENAQVNSRTTETILVFNHPFRLPGVDNQLPAGRYVVETDEEPILGLSFMAYRRVRTSIIVPAPSGSLAGRQVVDTLPEDLAAAHARDATLGD
jgi:hypothetical protein